MNRRLQKIVYEWPPNLTQYEATIFMGLSTTEAVGGGIALIAAVMLIPHKVVGGVVGVLAALLVVLALKKMERLGNISIPVFLWKRWRASRNPRQVFLTEIIGARGGAVHLEDADGHILTIE